MDTVLIENNTVVQVWRNKVAEDLNLPDAQLVEFESGTAIAGMVFDGETVSIPPKPITSDDVNRERDRRQSIAIPVQVNAETVFYVDVDEKSRTFILAVEAMADLTTDNIDFTGADNVTRSLTPSEIKLMAAQVFLELARIHALSNTIKAMSPIPTDYTDDSYWL